MLAQLPIVDAAKQQADLAHWQGVLRQVDALHPAQLSPDERVNYQVFRAQIIVLINQQRFREYERPVNSDTTFWSDEEDTGRQTFRTEQDYVHYLSQLKDLPRYFRENIANMRAGLARGFTPPKVTLNGRDAIPAASVRSEDAAGHGLLQAVREDAGDNLCSRPADASRARPPTRFRTTSSRSTASCSPSSATTTFRMRRPRSPPRTCPTARPTTSPRFSSSPRSPSLPIRFTGSASARWRRFTPRCSRPCSRAASRAISPPSSTSSAPTRSSTPRLLKTC